MQRRDCAKVQSAHLPKKDLKCVYKEPPPPFFFFLFSFSGTRWLHGLIETYGGVQPDTDEVHVPAGQKSDVKGWYDEELHSGNDELIKVSNQHFNKVWANSFPHLKCRAFLRWICLCTCTLVHKQISDHMVVPSQICCM